MAVETEAPCPKCGANLELSCGAFMSDGKLDLILECEDDCGMGTLNALIAMSDFHPVE